MRPAGLLTWCTAQSAMARSSLQGEGSLGALAGVRGARPRPQGWRSRPPREPELGEPGEVCKRSNGTYTSFRFYVPRPELCDARDTVATSSPGGRQTWHQTRGMGW